MPELIGRYIYSDFYSGTIWSVVEGSEPNVLLASSNRAISRLWPRATMASHGVDYSGGIWKLELNLQAGSASSCPPACVRRAASIPATRPSPHRRRRYEINAILVRRRRQGTLACLPEQSTIAVEADGDWSLPAGSVVVKLFRVDDRPVETRLFSTIPTVAGRATATRGTRPEPTPSCCATARSAMSAANNGCIRRAPTTHGSPHQRGWYLARASRPHDWQRDSHGRPSSIAAGSPSRPRASCSSSHRRQRAARSLRARPTCTPTVATATALGAQQHSWKISPIRSRSRTYRRMRESPRWRATSAYLGRSLSIRGIQRIRSCRFDCTRRETIVRRQLGSWCTTTQGSC